jgi:hypothetical protein
MLAGVISRETKDAVRPCGDGTIFCRVDAHRQFIVDEARRAGFEIDSLREAQENR